MLKKDARWMKNTFTVLSKSGIFEADSVFRQISIDPVWPKRRLPSDHRSSCFDRSRVHEHMFIRWISLVELAALAIGKPSAAGLHHSDSSGFLGTNAERRVGACFEHPFEAVAVRGPWSLP